MTPRAYKLHRSRKTRARWELVAAAVQVERRMRREIMGKWFALTEEAKGPALIEKTWKRMLSSTQISGLVAEESVAQCRHDLVSVFTAQAGIFELFLHHAAVRDMQQDEQLRGGPSYSLEVPKIAWLDCCSALGVLPPEPDEATAAVRTRHDSASYTSALTLERQHPRAPVR
eukprot:3620767-Prymnesium_polylepis.2